MFICNSKPEKEKKYIDKSIILIYYEDLERDFLKHYFSWGDQLPPLFKTWNYNNGLTVLTRVWMFKVGKEAPV